MKTTFATNISNGSEYRSNSKICTLRLADNSNCVPTLAGTPQAVRQFVPFGSLSKKYSFGAKVNFSMSQQSLDS
jgi:hypothetical protein